MTTTIEPGTEGRRAARPRREAKAGKRLTGLVMVAVLVALFALAGAFYTRAFADTVEVSVTTARGGLIMDPGNKVKYRGVEVGRITEVTKTRDGARLVIALDAGRAPDVPGNVGAEIRASTIFGAKYVELMDASTPSSRRIKAGAVIDATSVTREINTLFESIDGVVTTIDVAKLNTTLSTLSTALAGRGDDIADLARTLDNYFTQLEPALPQLRRDLRQLADLTELGVRTEPALVEILDNAAVTSSTIVDQQAALDRVLVDLELLGQIGSDVLGANTDALVVNLRQLRPTSAMLAEYSSELPCFLHGIKRAGTLARNGAGGTTPGLNVLATLRSRIRPYQPGVDRPEPLAGTGPACGPLPYLDKSEVPAPDITQTEGGS